MAKGDTAVEKELWYNRLYTVLLVMQYKGEDTTKTHRGTRHCLQRWRHRRGLRLRKFVAHTAMEKEELHGKACAHTDTQNTDHG